MLMVKFRFDPLVLIPYVLNFTRQDQIEWQIFGFGHYKVEERSVKLKKINFYNQKEIRLKIFYFEFKWLSPRYIFQVKTSL